MIIDKVGQYRTGQWAKRSENSIKFTNTHHTAVPENGMTDLELLKAIQGWHQGNGWPGASYHIVITRNGNRYRLNENGEITWHTANFNFDTVGIVLDGYFHPPYNERPTEAQVASLRQTLGELKNELPNLEANNYHRDYNRGTIYASACPGDIMEEYRSAFDLANIDIVTVPAGTPAISTDDVGDDCPDYSWDSDFYKGFKKTEKVFDLEKSVYSYQVDENGFQIGEPIEHKSNPLIPADLTVHYESDLHFMTYFSYKKSRTKRVFVKSEVFEAEKKPETANVKVFNKDYLITGPVALYKHFNDEFEFLDTVTPEAVAEISDSGQAIIEGRYCTLDDEWVMTQWSYDQMILNKPYNMMRRSDLEGVSGSSWRSDYREEEMKFVGAEGLQMYDVITGEAVDSVIKTDQLTTHYTNDTYLVTSYSFDNDIPRGVRVEDLIIDEPVETPMPITPPKRQILNVTDDILKNEKRYRDDITTFFILETPDGESARYATTDGFEYTPTGEVRPVEPAPEENPNFPVNVIEDEDLQVDPNEPEAVEPGQIAEEFNTVQSAEEKAQEFIQKAEELPGDSRKNAEDEIKKIEEEKDVIKTEVRHAFPNWAERTFPWLFDFFDNWLFRFIFRKVKRITALIYAVGAFIIGRLFGADAMDNPFWQRFREFLDHIELFTGQ